MNETNKSIHINAECFWESEQDQKTILFIEAPTRITYSVQVGGLGCTQKVIEGFWVTVGTFGRDLNDCAALCWAGSTQDKYCFIKEIEKSLNTIKTDYYPFEGFKVVFDYSKIEDLTEGWWPVLLKGNIPGLGLNKEAKGYIHTGNCD